MTDSKKKRMSMLDSLAAAGTPPAPGSMMSSNRALRSARDAVDAHHVWELDPAESKTSVTRIGSTQRMCTIFARQLNKTGRRCPSLLGGTRPTPIGISSFMDADVLRPFVLPTK